MRKIEKLFWNDKNSPSAERIWKHLQVNYICVPKISTIAPRLFLINAQFVFVTRRFYWQFIDSIDRLDNRYVIAYVIQMELFFIESCVVRHQGKCITCYVIFPIACLIPINRVCLLCRWTIFWTHCSYHVKVIFSSAFSMEEYRVSFPGADLNVWLVCSRLENRWKVCSTLCGGPPSCFTKLSPVRPGSCMAGWQYSNPRRS